MYISTVLLTTLFSSLALAQNPFSFVTLPKSLKVNEPFNITWSPSTGTSDTVTLLLRQGDPGHLATVATIAKSIENTGCYIWTPTSALVAGSGYAFEIVNDANESLVNYSGRFAIDSPNTISSVPAKGTSTSFTASGTGALATPTVSSGAGAGNSNGTAEISIAESGEQSGNAAATKTGGSGSATQTDGPALSDSAGVIGVKISGGLLVAVGAAMVFL